MSKFYRRICLLLSALTIFCLMSSCKSFDDLVDDWDDNDEYYNIVYYMPYNTSVAPQKSVVQQIEETLNEYLLEKINATVTIKPYILSEYATRVGAAISANIEFDLCFTNPSINSYLQNIAREAFLPLDKILPKYAPETWAAFDERIWNQARVNGRIYGVINEQIFPRSYPLYVADKDMMQQFLNSKYPGKTTETVYETGVEPFEFIREYCDFIRTKKGSGTGFLGSFDAYSYLLCYCGFDDLVSGMEIPGVVDIHSEDAVVFNQFKSQQFKYMIDQIYDLKKDGYIEGNKWDIKSWSTWKPDYLIGQLIRMGDFNYFTSYVIGTMNAISSTSKNPARVMKFIELMRTDPYVHSLLQFGIEGVHYEKDESNPNRIKVHYDNGWNNSRFGWGLGSEFTSYLLPDQSDDLWERTKEINDTTPLTPYIGFSFNPLVSYNIQQKIASCRAIVDQYVTGLCQALYEYSEYESIYYEFISKLDAAGAEDIIAEKQRQLNEFLKKNN